MIHTYRAACSLTKTKKKKVSRRIILNQVFPLTSDRLEQTNAALSLQNLVRRERKSLLRNLRIFDSFVCFFLCFVFDFLTQSDIVELFTAFATNNIVLPRQFRRKDSKNYTRHNFERSGNTQ